MTQGDAENWRRVAREEIQAQILKSALYSAFI